MTEVQELLAQALTELPGGPIVPPVGLGGKAERRRAIRGRVQVGVVGLAVVGVVGVGALVASRPSGRPTPAQSLAVSLCPGGSTDLVAAPADARPASTAEEAAGVPRQIHQRYARGHQAPPVLAVEGGRLVWTIDVLTAPDAGALQRYMWLLPDGTLRPERLLTCDVPPQLAGTTSESLPYPLNDGVDRPETQPVIVGPVPQLTRDGASIPWRVASASDSGNTLELSFSAGCHGTATVHVEQSPTFVLVQVLRQGPESGLLCVDRQFAQVTLDEPLNGRLLLHAATREILPSKAYERDPGYLPPGAKPISDTTDHSLRTRVWSLPDGRRLTLYVGIRSAFDAVPETTTAGPYLAKTGTVDGAPDLAWEENGVPLQVRLSRRAESIANGDSTVLHLVAAGLYTPEYVGLTVDEARAVGSSYGLELRVVREDGKQLVVLANFDSRRVNVAVVRGRVTTVESYS